MDYYEILMAISLPLGVIILLLLICRSLVLWYFRIPDMIKRQDTLINTLKQQNELLRNAYGTPSQKMDDKQETKKPSFTELRYGNKK